MNKAKTGIFWWLAVILDAGGAAALLLGLSTHWLVAWLVPVNVVTFLLYAYDKPAARAGRLRVPERLLHVHALIGGSPAAIASQYPPAPQIREGQFPVRDVADRGRTNRSGGGVFLVASALSGHLLTVGGI